VYETREDSEGLERCPVWTLCVCSEAGFVVRLNRAMGRRTSGRCEVREGEAEQDGAPDRQSQWRVMWKTLRKWCVEAETKVGTRDSRRPNGGRNRCEEWLSEETKVHVHTV
jgi:hypothetical protein